MVDRFYARNEAIDNLEVETPAIDLMDESVQVAIAFPGSAASQIVEDGEFRNLHQTGTTSINSNSTHTPMDVRFNRKNAEDANIGIKIERHYSESYDSLTHEIRPKQGYVFFGKRKKSTPLCTTAVWRSFGDHFAVLKNHVKKRSIWKPSDMLSTSQPFTFHKKFRTMPQVAAPRDPAMDPTYYFSTSIYGKVSIYDVEYFLVPNHQKALMGQLRREPTSTISKLLNTEIPVYTHEIVNFNGREEPVKKRRLRRRTYQ